MNKIETTVVHCKKEKYDVYIGRPSKWGNPFTHLQDGKTLAKFIVATRDEAVEKYEEWILGRADLLEFISPLDGKILGCWCKSKTKFVSCHGDILSDLCNLKTSLRITEAAALVEIYKIKKDDLISNRIYSFNESISKQI